MRTVYEDTCSSVGTVLRCYLLGSIVNCILTFSFFLATLLSLTHTRTSRKCCQTRCEKGNKSKRASERDRIWILPLEREEVVRERKKGRVVSFSKHTHTHTHTYTHTHTHTHTHVHTLYAHTTFCSSILALSSSSLASRAASRSSDDVTKFLS